MTPLSIDNFRGICESAGTVTPISLEVKIPIITFKPPRAKPKIEATISEVKSKRLAARISPPAIRILILNARDPP
jgi:hypothetical protein